MTPTTYMVVYCITVWASAWATESRGLRPVALIASGSAALGAGIKVFDFVPLIGEQIFQKIMSTVS